MVLILIASVSAAFLFLASSSASVCASACASASSSSASASASACAPASAPASSSVHPRRQSLAAGGKDLYERAVDDLCSFRVVFFCG